LLAATLGKGATKQVKMQKNLSADQLEAFYHSEFVEDQLTHFESLLGPHALGARDVIVDVGGGAGHFAAGLRDKLGVRTRVVDLDPVSVAKGLLLGIEAVQGDATDIIPAGDEAAVCFNLILHHLVGASPESTRSLQVRALSVWNRSNAKIFVNEYIYESFIPGFSGALIYEITSSRVLSSFARLVSKVVPAFRANTFGVGVRFRGETEWITLFRDAGFEAVGRLIGPEEHVRLPLRLLLIRSIRRSSFLLRRRDS
jgi:hypothetical protein